MSILTQKSYRLNAVVFYTGVGVRDCGGGGYCMDVSPLTQKPKYNFIRQV